MVKNKRRRKFYEIVISDPDSIRVLPYYNKCVSIGNIESLDLNIYKNSKLCFTIFVHDKSYIIDLECLPINKLK